MADHEVLGTLLVVGQGYVGLPVAVRAAEVGYQVIGYDLDVERVGALQAGRSYVEDISDERLGAVIAAGRYTAIDSLVGVDGFDVAVVSVPTPLQDGTPDLSFIESAAAAIAPIVQAGSTVILESTTYPGTTEELFGPIIAAGSGLAMGTGFRLGYSPERIDPGNQTYTLENTPKVVSGVDAASLSAVQAFFDHLVETTVPVQSTKTAELTKLLENTFRHVNIALVNELAMFAADLDIDVWEAIDAATTKPFGYLRFTPGPGVGGHCLPVDPSYLSWQVKRQLGRSFRFVELANDVNDHMPDYIVDRAVESLNEVERSVKGSRVLLLGVAYKKNTGDARETPARRIAEKLRDLGADLVACDPYVADRFFPGGAVPVEFGADELAKADLVILLVDHDDFDLDLVRRSAGRVLDTRNALGRSATVDVL